MAKATCSVPGCDRPLRCKELCGLHYGRKRRTGEVGQVDPVITPLRGVTDEERFFAKVDRNGPIARNNPELGRCWIWTASTTDFGYGRFSTTSAECGWMVAHRWSYLHWVGTVPDDKVLDHFACDRPACCNPRHVRPASQRENVLRSDNAAAWHLAKTHCIYGHEFTPENTHWSKRGRDCRACIRRRKAEIEQRGKRVVADASHTHCVHGHELTPENTLYTKRGGRLCRTCRRDSQRRAYWKRKTNELESRSA